jgi:hypothetical protein
LKIYIIIKIFIKKTEKSIDPLTLLASALGRGLKEQEKGNL